MEIQSIEDAIVERLTVLVDEGLAIENSPRLQRPGAKAKLQVFYEGRSATPPQDTTGMVVQNTTMRYRLNLALVDLRTHQGIYPYLDRIKSRLTGFQPLGEKQGKLYLVNEDYQEDSSGAWFYTMSFAFAADHLQTER